MIVLVGFMGAGKSSAAREIAADLGVEALDADVLLAERLGTSIPAFFAERGEEEFRRREEELVLELLGRDGAVLALGGGAVESPRVREALRAHRVVLLDVDAETAWKRCRASDRPLARDRAAFDALLARRRPLYDEVARVVVPGRRGLARRALSAVPEGLRAVWATTSGGEYPVVVGHGARHAGAPAPGRAFVVTDDGVPERWHGGADHVLPAGEEHKTLASAEAVWRAMARAQVTRADHVRAVGGGVVTDLAGFCAATYQRGVPVVHVPTTLLAMVDAAIGGKTGVDLPEAKNYVGAYHQPRAVLADLDTLATLPAAQVAEGWAEVVKTALVAGGALWERVSAGAEPADEEIVFACARTKVAVVAEDERDAGRRQVLNLGHTVGHALETASGYALSHGQAVGLGLLAALRLSGQEALRAQVAALLAARGLPASCELDVDAVLAATRRDKKRTGDDVPFVLVAAPGDVRHGQPVEEAALRAAVEELRR